MIALSNCPGSGSRDTATPTLSSPNLAEGTKGEAIRERLARTPSLLPWTELLGVVAEHDVPVLLTGETGAGKTWLARIIHDCSPSKHEPFVTVACGALPAQLVESEFFGHVRGAFTGADHNRIGKIAAAGRGTLLLDEVDTLSLEQQAKLLRALDSGEYEALGSNATRQRTCRIMAASNADLGALVGSGAFRSDLYYRLLVIPFHLPPLRERVEDIAPLALELTSRYAAQFGKALLGIGPEALALLESYSWPGNLRELDNVMRQAVLLSRGEVLLPGHLPARVRESQAAAQPRAVGTANSLRGVLEATERGLMQRVLADSGHSRSRAAKQLGISRVTLHRKMKQYGLIPA
jgi:transcriptional regulator with PAS, ATPase and Fis domain